MNLSFKDLQKREVVSVTDGKNLGHITDMTLSFPKGELASITVPRKKGIFSCFGWGEKTVIETYKIKKIGADVILVDLGAKKRSDEKKETEPVLPCPPHIPCPPPPVPPCPPPMPPERVCPHCGKILPESSGGFGEGEELTPFGYE